MRTRNKASTKSFRIDLETSLTAPIPLSVQLFAIRALLVQERICTRPFAAARLVEITVYPRFVAWIFRNGFIYICGSRNHFRITYLWWRYVSD